VVHRVYTLNEVLIHRGGKKRTMGINERPSAWLTGLPRRGLLKVTAKFAECLHK